MTFASPYFLLLLLLIVPYVLWYFLFRKRHEGALTLATTETFRNAPRTWRNRLIHLPFFLRLFCFVAVVLVMARPQTSHSWNKDETEGIHIVLAMDISTSMLTQDIAPNRITAAKDVATEFVNHRPSDNIGLTLFGGEAFTQCPLTTDHGMLLRALGNASCELQGQGLIQPGTAIGMGLASAVAHVERAEGKSKVVVPEAFFKVVLCLGDNPKAVGFIYKNEDGNRPMGDYVNTVDQVERITGIDFFPTLPDSIESRIEAETTLL